MAMSKAMRMMAASYATNRSGRSRSEYGGSSDRRMIGYDRPENTYKDRDNDGRYNENNRASYSGMDYATESRRQRDSRGRYMSGEGWEGRSYNGYNGYDGGSRSEYDENKYAMGGVENRRRRDSRGRYMMDEGDDSPHGQAWNQPQGNANRPGMYPGNEYGDIYAKGMIYAPGAMNKSGMGGSQMSEKDFEKPVDERTARKWVRRMSMGEQFKIDTCEALRNSLAKDCEKWEFYTAMNAMYSDHCETAKKLGMDKPEFYAHLAKDFLMDDDAGEHKLRKYMTYIAET